MANPIDIPIIGSSKNVPQDNPGYTLNMYSEEVGDGVFTLKPTPGTELEYEVTGAAGGCRGQAQAQGRYFVVIGANFYERVGTTFVTTFINPPATGGPYVGTASLNTTQGEVAMITNNPPGSVAQILIVDDENGYVFELGANPGEGGWVSAATMNTNGFRGGKSQAAFCAGRGIAIVIDPANETQQWQFSKLYDFQDWNDVNDTGFATALSLLDDELRAVASNGDLCYFFSGRGFEVWKNVGTSPNPLQRILAYDKIGIIAPRSAQFSERWVYWLGGTIDGQGVVYRHTGGGAPERISDHPTERNIAALPSIGDATGAVMYALGHVFYLLTFRAGNRTLAYDWSTGMWAERAQRNKVTGDLNALPFVSIIIFNGKYLGIDYSRPKIWNISDTLYQDDGNPIKRIRKLFPVPAEADRLTRYESAELFCEVGNTPAGQTDPKVEFRYSVDRGQTWSHPPDARSVGGNNSYETRVRFYGLGAGYSISMWFEVIANQYISWRKVRLRAK